MAIYTLSGATNASTLGLVAGDEVRLNGHDLVLDQASETCAKISQVDGDGNPSGGTISFSPASATRTLTCDIYAGNVNGYIATLTSGMNLTINGTCYGGASTGAKCFRNNGGTLTVTAAVGGTGANAWAIVCSAGTSTITTSTGAPSGATVGTYCDSSSTVTIGTAVASTTASGATLSNGSPTILATTHNGNIPATTFVFTPRFGDGCTLYLKNASGVRYKWYSSATTIIPAESSVDVAEGDYGYFDALQTPTLDVAAERRRVLALRGREI